MKENPLAKTLRYFVYACAFVPLIIFSDYISPFHFGKVIIFRSLVEVMLVFYLLLVWKDRSYMPKMNIVSWAFLAFSLAFSLTTFTSIIPYSSMWGSLERMGGLFTFWHYFLFFIMMASVYRTERHWLNLFNLTIALGIISAFYGFGQRTDIQFFVGSGGRERIFGTIGNPALFAGYQVLILFVAITLFFHSKSTKNFKIFYGSSAFILVLAIMMTAVRGSIMAIGAGFLVFALLYSSVYRSRKAKNILLGLIGIIILFVLLALLLKNTSFIQDSRYLKRITEFSLTNYTVQTRFWAWQAGLKGWEEGAKTIIFGWGPENFNIPFSKYFNPKFFRGPGSETLFDRAHNMFVEILVTMGLAGFLTYLSIFGASFKVLWKKLSLKGDEALYGVGFISLLIAYAIHNSFIFDTSANFLVFFTILGFIYFLQMPKEQAKPRLVRVNGGLYALVATGLFIASIIFVYKINILPAKANYTSTRAIVAGWNNDFSGAIAKYKEALAYNVPGKYEIRHRYAQYVLEKTNSAKMTPEYEIAIKDAIEEVTKNVNENPPDYLPYLYIARLYIILGKEDPDSPYNEKSLEFSLAALDLAPDFVRAYYEVGQAYLNKRDLDNAAKYFKKSAELNPEVGLSSWYWGVVEIERGNTELGLSIVEGIMKNGIYVPVEGDLNRLISIYVKKGDYGKIVWAYEMLVAVNGGNAQYRASLAVAYARIGKVNEAIEQAKKAAEIDPNFESEAHSFVSSLGREW